jgi:hypothetical protein
MSLLFARQHCETSLNLHVVEQSTNGYVVMPDFWFVV